MEPIRITGIGVAHPPRRITQPEAARRIAALAGGNPRRVEALARATGIETRAIILPPDEIPTLGSIAERNAIYGRLAPGLAREAARGALASGEPASVTGLFTSSCTGYALPGWGSGLLAELGLGCETVRVPITEAGCAGGAVTLARAADYLRSRPGQAALAVATELCSLAYQRADDDGILTASLIFGDGAGAALLASGPGDGIEIVDSASLLVPGTEEELGFELTDRGFSPVLGRRLAATVSRAAIEAAARLLGRNGLARGDVGAWLVHPGGARILEGIERGLGISREAMRWSWASMAEFGNTSSAAIFDVLRRYIEDTEAQPGWGIVAAFGPGVSVELLLVRRPC